MEHTEAKQLADQVLAGFIEIEASGRHVHVTVEQAMALFGHRLSEERPLSQPGQFLARERVTVVGPKGRFENVAVLGPERPAGQVEISLTDARVLGLKVPVRLSGDITQSPGAVLVGSKGQTALKEGVIAARRHVHLSPEDAARFGVKDGDSVRLQVYAQRPAILQQVAVRVSREFASYVHLDYDEANACGLHPGDLGRILP